MFLGLGFCSDSNSFSNTVTLDNTITKIQIAEGIYDYLFGSDNPNINLENKEWNYDTRFYARFQNNLFAGNVDYAANIVSSVKIKRREQIKTTWITLFNIPINSNDDFNFELTDRYAQGKHDYVYAFVPVIDNIEGNLNTNNITSEFNDYFLLDKDISYPIFLNTSFDTTINKPTETIATLGRKYPFVISNGLSQYITGSLSFSLAQFIDCAIETDNYEYKFNFNTWLMNGKPKILKDWLGNIHMISITDNVPIDYEIYDLPSYKISFTEIGDCLSQYDLYYNNFINSNMLLSG